MATDAITKMVNSLAEQRPDYDMSSGGLFTKERVSFDETETIKVLGNRYTLTVEKVVKTKRLLGFDLPPSIKYEISMLANSDSILSKTLQFEIDASAGKIVAERIRTAVLMAHSDYVEGE